MQYPSSLKFSKVENGIKMKRIKEGKYSPDIWAMSYSLNEGLCEGKDIISVYVNPKDTTEILRTYFLPQVFRGFQFLPDINKKAEGIIDKVMNKEFVTYEHDYKFKVRGTKNKQESLLERYIFNNLSRCFGKEFKNNKIGLRQFPANIFSKIIKKSSRKGRKFWIDILTVNSLNHLSVIELKAGQNAPLDLFIQSIDYGIFAHLFKEHISDYPFIKNKRILSNKVAIYLVAEKFHPAITGGVKIKGITSRLKTNELFDIHLIQFKKKGSRLSHFEEIICI